MSKQYIEINGHRLDYDPTIGYYEAEIGGKPVAIGSWVVETLGFEIYTPGPKFEDIPDGIYSPGGESYNRVFGLHEGQWYSAGGEEATDIDVTLLKAWHHRGRLIKLEKGKSTNE